jgi:uncharacterized protein YkwD
MRYLGVISVLLAIGCGDLIDLGEPDPSGPGPSLVNYCPSVEDWNTRWTAFEEEVLRLTNEVRAEGADCGIWGHYDAVPSLEEDDLLRCAARNHSADMGIRNFFAHENPDGETPYDRIDYTGYVRLAAGENIAAGQRTPAEVVSSWVASDGHCQNIMRSEFTELGVGYYYEAQDTYEHYWTQVFGAPP